MLVKAIKDCFVAGSLRKKDEEFDYAGPKNSNLEPARTRKAEPEQPAKYGASETKTE